MSNTFVVVLGVGTVFVGLICLILLCKIVGLFCGLNKRQEKSSPVTSVATPTAISEPIENRQEIIAAVSAAIAEELGTDISALRILSFKKI